MDTFEEIMGDPGDTPPTDAGAAETALEASELDSSADTTTGGEIPEGGAADQTIEETEITEEGQEPAVITDKPGETEEEITEEAIAQALESGKKDRKWWEKAVTYKNTQLAERETELEGFRVYGSRDQLEKLKKYDDYLNGFEEKEGTIVSRIPQFASEIVKESPEKAIELLNSLVSFDSPVNPGKSLFDELIELPDVQADLKNRFAVSSEDDPNLSVVPKDKIKAYNSLEESIRKDFRFMAEEARAAILNRARAELQKADERQAAIKKQNETNLAKFNTDVEETTAKNFDSVTDEFYKSLKQIPFNSDPKLNSFLQSTVYDKVLTVITMGETYAGKRAVKDLADFGLTLAPETSVLVKKLEADSRLITIAAYKNNKAAIDYYASEILTTQKQLAGRANEIGAAIAKAVNDLAKRDGTNTNTLLDTTKAKTRPAVAGGGGGSGKQIEDRDLSRVSFEDILAED